jgi:hypothetical protein
VPAHPQSSSFVLIPAVELPPWSLFGVAEDFARMQILLSVFDGDPDKWLAQINMHGGAELDRDADFLREVRQRLEADPSFLDDMRRILREFADRVGTA